MLVLIKEQIHLDFLVSSFLQISCILYSIFSLFLTFRLTSEDLDGIIEEIDEDGSGTMDFDEFCQMMMS